MMNIDEKLQEKFDRVEDLPVSEELYGAYLEGNLTNEEAAEVEAAIADSDLMAEIDVEMQTETDASADDVDPSDDSAASADNTSDTDDTDTDAVDKADDYAGDDDLPEILIEEDMMQEPEVIIELPEDSEFPPTNPDPEPDPEFPPSFGDIDPTIGDYSPDEGYFNPLTDEMEPLI
ncbi:MAG: hypothetical protein SO006_01880 [Muribaculaceae bacterium]|nr:hypothetical protein [Muribaculaceae bacterium]